jgi:medium-chain acyl-[acyl-carrier-protein] hydrolase
LRLFCFHHAGGAAHVFLDWSARLPDGVEVCPVQLPGHATRAAEPLQRDLAALVGELREGLAPELGGRFAFFGHSLGALLAFELARELRRLGWSLPAHLFVAGRVAPATAPPPTPTKDLPDAAFIREMQSHYDAIPAAVLAEPDLLALTLPVVRADMEVVTSYRYRPEAPLPCGISAYGGVSDASVPRDQLAAWGAETVGRFSFHMVEGDHWFATVRHEAFLAVLTNEIQPLL